MDPVVLAAPLFLALVAAEALVLRLRAERPYRLNDFVSGLSCGVLDQVANAAVIAWYLALFAEVQARYGLLPVRARSPRAWVACVLAHDLAYYAFHRASHRVSALWAAHAVHHQSEEYNFTVSLRQGAIATPVTLAFYLPLALVGFPVGMFAVVHGAHQVFQFFVHTRLVGRMGVLERVLATPSHHRVHHGREREFHDANYGGFLIVWDKLFGTFVPETREPRYGVTEGLASWSPLWANLAPYAALAARSARVEGLRAKLAVWLGPPEARYPGEEPASGATSEGYDRKAPRELRAYVLAQSLLIALVAMVFVYRRAAMEPGVATSLALFVVATLVALNAFNDRRSWARGAEIARLTLGATGAAIAFGMGKMPLAYALPWIAGCVISGRVLDGAKRGR